MPGRYWDRAWNPVTGCTPCSPACEHCWAAGMVRRFPHLHGWGPDLGPLPFSDCVAHPQRVGSNPAGRKPKVLAVCWLGDLWHTDVPQHWRRTILGAMRTFPQHTYLCLTKRGERLVEDPDLPAAASEVPGLWIGMSAWDGPSIDDALVHLREIPGTDAHRWLSIEPLLGDPQMSVGLTGGDILGCCGSLRTVNQVVVGPETGPGRRPCEESWIHTIELACGAAGVPCWRKDTATGRLAWREGPHA